MYKNKTTLFLMLFVTTVICAGCSSTNSNAHVIPFSFAESSQGAGLAKYFTLYFKTNTLVIWDDPRFTWNSTNVNLYDIEWQILDLSELLEQDFPFVESLAYASFEDDLIIVLVSSNGDFAGSKIARIDGITFIPEWATDFAGFNIGEPIIRNNSLYVTSIGAIGKINVDTGEFLWEYTDLYERDSQDFNSFKAPVFSDTKIIFQGDNIFSTCPKRIEVNDSDGSILNIVETCFP